MDYCNHADFTFYYDKDSVHYDTEVYNFLSQPFIKREKDNRINFYNYSINKSLTAILPKSSLLRSNLQLDLLLDNYITWFIKN